MCHLEDIRKSAIDKFCAAQRTKVSDNTVNHHLALLSSLLNYAEEIEWLESAPTVRKLKLPELPYKYIKKKEQITRLLVNAKVMSSMHEVLYATAIYTGMRLGELAGLAWERVDFDQQLIHVVRSYDEITTKGSKLRYIPIMKSLRGVLLEHWKQSGCPETGLVFPYNNKMATKDALWFRRDYAACLKVSNIPKMRFHDTRHTFASHYLLNGGDIYRLQKLLGHDDIKTTMIYAHLCKDAFAVDLDRM